MTTPVTARFVQAGVAVAMLAAAWPAVAQVPVPLGAERYEVTITPPPRPGSAAALKPRAAGTDGKAPDAAAAAQAPASTEAAPAGQQPLAGAASPAVAPTGSVAGGSAAPPKPGAGDPAAPEAASVKGGPATGAAATASGTTSGNAAVGKGGPTTSRNAAEKPGAAPDPGSDKPSAAIPAGARSAASAATAPAVPSAPATPVAPKPPGAAPAKSAPQAVAGPARSLQVGAFRLRKSATALRQELAGFPDVQVSEVSSGGEPLFRVTVGRLPKGKALDELKRRLSAAGHPVFEIAAPGSTGPATR